MCGIAGSFDVDQLNRLALLNTKRGNRRHTLTLVDPESLSFTTFRSDQPYDGSILKHMKKGQYGIIHVQAPTTTHGGTHPATYWDYGLIHNGLLKPKYMRSVDHDTSWDTEWLLRELVDNDSEQNHFTNVLSEVDGSFSCVLLKQQSYIWLFRNSIAPMYINDLDFSSIEVEGFKETQSDTVYRLDISEGYCFPVSRFDNKEEPYVGVK